MNHVFAALAVPHRDADVVGPVRITCEPLALRIELCGVRRHARGFVPGGIARDAAMTVPYSAVRALVRRGPVLLLGLEPRVAAPYARFALARFSEDASLTSLNEGVARRRLETLVLALVAMLVGLVSFVAASAVARTSSLAAASLAAVVAFASYGLAARLRAELFDGGVRSRRRMRELEALLGERVGLEGASLELMERAAAEAPVAELLGLAGRTRRLALALVGVAVGVGVAVTVVRRFGVASRVTLPVPAALRGIEPEALRLGNAAQRLVTPVRAACRCARAETSLWKDGVASVSVLVSPRRGALDAVWLAHDVTYSVRADDEPAAEPSAPRVDFDVVVVNNGRVDLDTVSLILTFARKSPSGDRIGVMERGLHYPARLRPAQAVRWRVRARGSEVRLTFPGMAKLGAEVEPAAADAFVALQSARLGAVRLHGAMMLGYLGAPGAEAVAHAITGLSPLEDASRRALLDALGPLKACEVTTSDGVLRACVHNGSKALLRAVTLADATPPVSGRSWTVDDLFFPARGLTVELPLEGAAPPHTLSVKAGREADLGPP